MERGCESPRGSAEDSAGLRLEDDGYHFRIELADKGLFGPAVRGGRLAVELRPVCD